MRGFARAAGRRLACFARRQAMLSPPILQSDLTCPKCGFVATMTMPTNACLYFYECTNCHVLLRPKEGDCCVFCSYGSVKCPPIQQALGCCVGTTTLTAL
jgi:hypothetical protein